MKTITELQDERQSMLDAAQALIDQCNGEMSTSQAAECQELLGKADAIGRSIEMAARIDAERSRPQNPEIAALVNGGPRASAHPNGSRWNSPAAVGPVFQDQNGNRIQARLANERFAPRPSDGTIGSALHALLRGDVQNANFGTSDTKGGYLISPEMSGMFLDLARSASVCMRAGAITIPMSTSEMTIATVTGDATPMWRAETVAVTSSEMTFGRITLRAKTLAAIVPVSIEMLEDAGNAATIIEQALSAKMGQMLDKAGLYGSGAASEPLGLKYSGDVNTVSSVGTPTAGATTYSKVITGIKNILDANFPGDTSELSWIQNPRDMTNWAALADTTYQPLAAPPMVAAMKQYATTALPRTEGGGGAESSAIIGHFPSLAFGMRTSGVVVQILDSGTVNDGTDDWNATSQLMKLIRVYMRADVAILRPTWFSVLSGITSA